MPSARRIAAALLVSITIFATFATAQPTGVQQAPPSTAAPAITATPAFPWEGEVTGTSVRVRSGAGTDWYATTKLDTGNRVMVVGEEHGWFRIVPPAGSFSYIDMTDVERQPAARQGKVNKDRVSVRAGSSLAASKSTTQAWINKGQTVEILGEADGFYKITPPQGAFLYITRQYVKPIAGGARSTLTPRPQTAANAPPAKSIPTPQQPIGSPTKQDANATAQTPTPVSSDRPQVTPSTGAEYTGDTPGEVATGDTTSTEDESTESAGMEGADPAAEQTLSANEPEPLETDPTIQQALKNREATRPEPSKELAPAKIERSSNRYQALLTSVEADLSAQMQLPLAERDLDSLLPRYQEIAAQTDERVPAEFAKIRVNQLQTLDDLRKTRAEAASTASDLDSFQARMTTERMSIMRARAEKVTEKFDFVGELRKSYAFAPEKRRFRLVDPKRQTTIAYVDIPRDVTENVDFMIGRTVGIHTAGQRYSQAARIPIAVAASLTDLTPSTNRPEGAPEGTPGMEIMPPELDDEGANPKPVSDKANPATPENPKEVAASDPDAD